VTSTFTVRAARENSRVGNRTMAFTMFFRGDDQRENARMQTSPLERVHVRILRAISQHVHAPG